jgi:hypothetical protein
VRIRDENRDRAGRFPNHEIHDRLGVLELHEPILRAVYPRSGKRLGLHWSVSRAPA